MFSILPINERKISAPVRLGKKLNFSSSFFGRIEDTKKAFRNELTFRSQIKNYTRKFFKSLTKIIKETIENCSIVIL